MDGSAWGGGWVHSQDERAWTGLHGLSSRTALVGTGWAISFAQMG